MKIQPGPKLDHRAELGDRGVAIHQIEKRLDTLGYHVGRVDGVFDRDTAKAVRAFKADEFSIDNNTGRLGERGQGILARRVGAKDPFPDKDANVRAVCFNWPGYFHKGGHAADEAMFERLGAKADVLGLTEVGWLGSNLTDGETKKWGFHHPNPANDGSSERTGQLLAWRKDTFKLVEKGTTLMNRRTRIQPNAAGPTMHKPKSIIWAKLRHRKTGEIWTVAVAHFVPSKHLGGAAEALWKKQRDAVAEWMKRQGPRTMVMGDFNGEWNDRIARPLHRVAENQSAPSHGNRKIDWILRSKDLEGVGPGRALDNHGQSDHRPVKGIVRG